MAEGVRASQRKGHRTSLEKVPMDSVRVSMSSAFDESAGTNPNEMPRSNQGAHTMAAVAAVGQVAGQRDAAVSGQPDAQELVHLLSVVRSRVLDEWSAQPVDGVTVATADVDHGIPCDPRYSERPTVCRGRPPDPVGLAESRGGPALGATYSHIDSHRGGPGRPGERPTPTRSCRGACWSRPAPRG